MIKHLYWLLASFILVPGVVAVAQVDTTYIAAYEHKVTGRFYFSQKYTAFTFADQQDDIRLRYLPNTSLNMGVGATYKFATINLAYGFGFLNPDSEKGKTKYLDLQAHLYGKKWLIDVLGQFYNGFYLGNKDVRDVNGNYYVRPDIKVREYGATAQYIVNHKHFSYRAGFLQNEWQKKSAGSLLLGLQILIGKGSADSTLVPYLIAPATDDSGRDISFFELGPSVGYVYTVVIKKNFFIMASASGTLSFGTNTFQTSTETTSTGFFPNLDFKAFAGYNSKLNAISLTFTNSTANFSSDEKDSKFLLSTGNLRLNFVHRFDDAGIRSLLAKFKKKK